MDTIKNLSRKSCEIRKNLIKIIYMGKSGHTGGALSSVDILTTLFYSTMKYNPSNPNWSDRDRFILSKGHSVEGYYCILSDLGFFSKEECETFSQYGSRLTGHPNNMLPGVEMNTGALGHGLSVSVGMALAGKMSGKAYRVFTLMGDGELAEGSIWEAAMSAAHYRLDNLIGIVDRNGLQISGETEKVMALENLTQKWQSFGWAVRSVDGHNFDQMRESFRAAPFYEGSPNLIIANTIKGKGVSYMENAAQWHHGAPTEEQYELALKELSGGLS